MADQNRIITPEHFKVAPEILGLPLASPSRRAFAMAVDLFLIAILVQAGGAFLGIVAAVLLFRASSRKQPGGSFIRQSVRFTLRIVGAIILFVVITQGSGNLRDRFTGKNASEGAETSDNSTADEVNLSHEATGTPPIVDTRVANIYVTALETNDTATAALYRDSMKEVVAGSEIAALESRAARFEAQRDSVDKELEEARKAHGLRAFISGAADDLGVGFGWSAVFFTAFLAMWGGQTPGKKLMGVRVRRLDGKPMGWWIAFERFGGYAASLSVGLLGFVQILWDRNRQGLHDKACETVVVREVNPVK